MVDTLHLVVTVLAMEAHMLNQSDVARVAGVSRQMISKLKKQGRLPVPAEHEPARWRLVDVERWVAGRRGARR